MSVEIAPVPSVAKWPTLPVPCLMYVAHQSPNVERTAEAAVKGGVNAIRLRINPASDDIWDLNLSESLALRVRGRAVVIVSHTHGLDEHYVADGIHLPESDNRRSDDIRGLSKNDRLIGRSVHSVGTALSAVWLGCDYLIAGTIYESASHPGKPGDGIDYLRAVCEAVDVPVIAIGGITPDRVDECIQAGASGIALITPLANAKNPRTVAEEYREALTAAWTRKHYDTGND